MKICVQILGNIFKSFSQVLVETQILHVISEINLPSYLSGMSRIDFLREGGGCVTGRVDESGKLTGSDIVYVYPDYLTCIQGEPLNLYQSV